MTTGDRPGDDGRDAVAPLRAIAPGFSASSASASSASIGQRRAYTAPAQLPTVGTARRGVGVFVRLHLVPMRARPRATLLAVVALAVATVVMVAMLMLSDAVVAPFTSLTEAMAPHAQLQIHPAVQDRLPEDLVARVAATPDVAAAIGWVGGLRMVQSTRSGTGTMLIGAGCDLSDRIGVAPCADDPAGRAGAGGPGVGVWVSPRTAAALGVRPGDVLGFSGGLVGDAHVAGILTLARGAAAERINAGHLVVARTADVQALLGAGPHLSAVFVATSRPADVRAHLAAFVPNATVGPLGADVRPFVQLSAVLTFFTGLLVVACGAMIFGGTFALMLDSRRRALAVARMLGRSSASTAAGLLAESVLLGLVAGLLSVPFGVVLGGALARLFAGPLLAGSGAQVSTPWSPGWILVSVGVGAICGFVASIPVVVRILARRSADMGGDDDLPVHRAQVWPIPLAGFCALGLPLGALWGSGRIPGWLGYLGFAMTVTGAISLGFGLAPRIVRRMRRLAGTSAPRLLSYADLMRDPLRFASAVAVVALATVALAGSFELRLMTVAQMSEDVRSELAGIVVSGPRTAGDQIDARLTASALDRLATLPGVASVSPQTLTVVHVAGRPVDVIGTDPQRPRRNLVVLDADPVAAWDAVANGAVIVGDVLANRLGLRAGSMLTLPTTAGAVSLPVAAVAEFHFGQDNGVGEMVVASTERTRWLWQAAPDGVLASPQPGVATAQLAHTFRTASGVVGLNAADADSADAYAELAGARFLQSIQWVGIVLVGIAAVAVANFLMSTLVTRRRTRAALRFVGYRVADERRSLIWSALTIGGLGGAFGLLAALAASAYLATASPAFLASPVQFRVFGEVLVASAVAIVAIVTIAVVPAGIRAGRGEVSRILTDES